VQVSPLTAPHLPVVPSPTTWAAWSSLHPPRQRDQRVSDFAMNEQARRSSPPNRVRYPTDQQFASGCSPPRLSTTQLPSATELWHTPTRTFTVLMWRPHGRTHSRMLLAGIHLRLILPLAPAWMPASAGMTVNEALIELLRHHNKPRYQAVRTGYWLINSSGVKMRRACVIAWQISIRSKGSLCSMGSRVR